MVERIGSALPKTKSEHQGVRKDDGGMPTYKVGRDRWIDGSYIDYTYTYTHVANQQVGCMNTAAKITAAPMRRLHPRARKLDIAVTASKIGALYPPPPLYMIRTTIMAASADCLLIPFFS